MSRSKTELSNPRVADRLHPLWDRWPTQHHSEHSPFWTQPKLRATENKTQTAAEANRRFLAQSAPFMHPSFLPKYWARYGNTLLDPRSVPEAFPLSLQSSSYFFESSQGRGPWQLHRIYDSGLTTPKLRQVMMHLGLDGRVQYQISINPTRINKKIRLQPGLGMEHSSCSTRCTR